MTLDELKKQRLEIDRQIRAIENNIVRTENFVVSKGNRKMLILRFRLSTESKHMKDIIATRPSSGFENDAAKNLVNKIQDLISQLETIAQQLNTDSPP